MCWHLRSPGLGSIESRDGKKLVSSTLIQVGDKNNWNPFNLTISQNFEYTPTPAEVITGFRYMKSSSLKYNHWRFSPTRSESSFLKAGIQVERYSYHSWICYQISLTSQCCGYSTGSDKRATLQCLLQPMCGCYCYWFSCESLRLMYFISC